MWGRDKGQPGWAYLRHPCHPASIMVRQGLPRIHITPLTGSSLRSLCCTWHVTLPGPSPFAPLSLTAERVRRQEVGGLHQHHPTLPSTLSTPRTPCLLCLQLKEYDGKKLVACTKEGLKFEDETPEERQAREAEAASFQPLCSLIKDILGDKVEKVRERVKEWQALIPGDKMEKAFSRCPQRASRCLLPLLPDVAPAFSCPSDYT